MSIVTITNSNGEKFDATVPELSEEVKTSGYIQQIDENSSIEEIEAITSTAIENKLEQPQFHNRAERRAFAKKLGKSGRAQFGTISETAKKLNYINLIQQLRELNEKKENENNEQATEN